MAVPSFTEPVPDNGYRWWYVDAISDDDQHAITVIVFIGSVFSPYYARARKRAPVSASDYCSINVALYGAPWRWCMTERNASSLRVSDKGLNIGRSAVQLEDGFMQVTIDEMAVPWPQRVRGTLTLALPDYDLARHPLDTSNPDTASHFWQPVAPQTRIDVRFDSPELAWTGNAYADSNYGRVPLESSFKSWVWSRSHACDKTTTVLYDIVDRQGGTTRKTLRFDAAGQLHEHVADHAKRLPPTRYWRIPREARTAADTLIHGVQTLEDTPFYSRSRFTETCGGQTQATVHESLYLDRFDTRWVRCLLPFRMPRRTRPVLPE